MANSVRAGTYSQSWREWHEINSVKDMKKTHSTNCDPNYTVHFFDPLHSALDKRLAGKSVSQIKYFVSSEMSNLNSVSQIHSMTIKAWSVCIFDAITLPPLMRSTQHNVPNFT